VHGRESLSLAQAFEESQLQVGDCMYIAFDIEWVRFEMTAFFDTHILTV
jgi:hypothetical protein